MTIRKYQDRLGRDTKYSFGIPFFIACLCLKYVDGVQLDGLDGELIYPKRTLTPSIRKDIIIWLERLSPWIKQFEYEGYCEVLLKILSHGNSADRQLAIFSRRENLHDVVLNNVNEFESNSPVW